MGATRKRIRETMKVGPTPRNKGLALNLRVVAYDNGMVEVDGVPMEAPLEDGGLLEAAEMAVATINEFRRQVQQRQRTR